MEVRYNYYTGSIFNINATLTRSVSRYLCHNILVKVGITNNPERRACEHRNGSCGWAHTMVVIYHTSSPNSVKEMERRLVDRYWLHLQNDIGGGGGPDGAGPYYLYVLLG